MKILIVEDDLDVRGSLRRMLENFGHKVFVAEDGFKALELIRKNRIRMVITDWMMPVMDGLELCRAIRKEPFAGYVFITILAERNFPDDIVAGLEAGADNYLCKPFNQAELMARLKAGMRILDLEESLQKANEEIKLLAIIDPLTECYNRRYLMERLPQEIKRVKRYSRSLSVVLCDIDHFKSINDTYGHPAGDRVLKAFVACIQGSIRQGVDWVARYGGEEFMVVLPETDINGACCLAERLRDKISKYVFKVKGKGIHITSSFGVTGFDASTPDEKISTEAMISQSDRFLYQSKQEGRNRTRSGHL